MKIKFFNLLYVIFLINTTVVSIYSMEKSLQENLSITELPYELKEHIVYFLVAESKDIEKNVKEICKLGCINKDWRIVINSLLFWKIVFAQFFRTLLFEMGILDFSSDKLRAMKTNLTLVQKSFLLILTSRKEQNLAQKLSEVITTAFNSVFKEANLNLDIHLEINNNEQSKVEEYINQVTKEGMITNSNFSIWNIFLLHRVIHFENIYILKKILILCPERINDKDKYGWTTLMTFAYKYIKSNIKEIFEILLEAHADVDAITIYGQTAMMMAAACGNREIMEMLVNHICVRGNYNNINVQDKHGKAALHLAAQNGRKEIIELLFSPNFNTNKYIDVDIKDRSGETPLMQASREGHKEIVEMLLQRKADINLQNYMGWTALMYAGEQGHLEIVKILLNNNAELDAKTVYGSTILRIARDNQEIVKFLYKHINKSNFRYI